MNPAADRRTQDDRLKLVVLPTSATTSADGRTLTLRLSLVLVAWVGIYSLPPGFSRGFAYRLLPLSPTARLGSAAEKRLAEAGVTTAPAVAFTLAERAPARLEVYDLAGRRV
ncbi:MAG: hypothetical protein ACRENS_10825 [Candidatus Eiseniibacteriota bacterium]